MTILHRRLQILHPLRQHGLLHLPVEPARARGAEHGVRLPAVRRRVIRRRGALDHVRHAGDAHRAGRRGGNVGHDARDAPPRGPGPVALEFGAGPFAPRLLAHLDLAVDFVPGREVDALVAFLPVDRAALAELVLEDERVEDALGLVHAAADVGVVDGDGAHGAFRVDDEQGALRDALVFDQHAVVAADPVVDVAHEGDVDAAEPAFHVRGVVPRAEAVVAVGADEDDGAGAVVEELFEPGGEGSDLGGADEGPGFGEEDEDEPVVGFGVGGEGDL